MNKPRIGTAPVSAWPQLWRIVTLAAATLILCSCQAPSTGMFDPASSGTTLLLDSPTGVTEGGIIAAGGALAPVATIDHPNAGATPLPHAVTGAWAPPGIATPWPPDEYLHDGGDRPWGAKVDDDWQIHGLEPEDTIAHYDTLDGRRVVEASNRVHVYAPRFGAVRSVTTVSANLQVDATRGMEAPAKTALQQEIRQPTTTLQNLEAVAQRGVARSDIYRTDIGDGALSTTMAAVAFQDAFLPFESLAIIRDGFVEGSEAPQLARGVAAAIAWTHDQAVQVILDRQAATAVIGDARAQATFAIDKPEPRPKLRIVKVASSQTAQVGEEVDFTIRFDNVGNEMIGNVTIVDHLTPRLEYLPESAQASVEGNFVAERKGADSLILRFEVTDPLEPGEGGIVRFRCRVR